MSNEFHQLTITHVEGKYVADCSCGEWSSEHDFRAAAVASHWQVEHVEQSVNPTTPDGHIVTTPSGIRRHLDIHWDGIVHSEFGTAVESLKAAREFSSEYALYDLLRRPGGDS